MSQSASTPSTSLIPKPTNFRWVICALLFYATTVNYIDRSTLNTLEPTLRDVIHWRPYQYGLINAVFSLAYGLGFLLMGMVIDKIGTRAGYAFAMIGWSIAGMFTAFTGTPMQFGLTRFFLGLFEAGNFPAAIKTVAEWFPQKQRATATGIFNAGSNVGAVCAPLIVLFLVPHFGWRSAFFITPFLVLIWVSLWILWYRAPAAQPRANDAERALIEADPIVKSVPVKWRNILPHPQTWAFMSGKFLTDPIWWFYLFWSGAFFNDKFHVKLTGVALPLIYIYILADLGSIAGGWLSSSFIKRGWTPNASRKVAMLICAAFVLPVIFAPLVPSDMAGGIWIAATLIGSAAAAHQGFSANIFTTTSDMFPKRAVSSITGLGGLAGALGSVILQSVAGVTIELTGGSYLPLFIVAACAYPIAIGLIHFFAPKMQPVGDTRLETTPMPRAVTAFMFAILGFVVAVPISYHFQNAAENRLYDVKTIVANTYRDMTDALPQSEKDKKLIASADVSEDKVALTTEQKQALATDPTIFPDFKTLLQRSDLQFKAVNFVVEFKDNVPDADLQIFRDNYKVSDKDSTYTPKSDDSVKKINAKLTIPFHVSGNVALTTLRPGYPFENYIAAVLPPGDVYKSIDRAKILPMLLAIPLIGIIIGGLLGALLHTLIFPRRSPAS